MSDKLSGRKGIQQLLTELSNHGRTDCYSAFDTRKGKGYKLQNREITDRVIDAHAINEQPIAIYLFKGEFTSLAALDVDNHDGALIWPELIEKVRPVVDELHDLGFKPLLVRSGGGAGIHIILAWGELQPARKVRCFLAKILKKCGFKDGTTGIDDGTIEIYPKQDAVPDGKFGNPIALPFARKSLPLDANLMPVPLDSYAPPPMEDLYGQSLSEFGDEHFESEPPGGTAELTASGISSVVLDGDEEEAESALRHIPSDDTDDWIRVGYALKQSFGPSAFAMWNRWSATSTKYPNREECRKVWDDLEPDGRVTIGSLFYMAQQKGWNGPSSPEIREMNAKYGILTYRNKTMIIEKEDDFGSDVLNWVAKESLKDRHRSETIMIPNGDGGQRPVSLVDHWLGHPKASHYRRVDFDPGKPPGDNGAIWNLWRGFAVTPKEGDWSQFKDHILNNICQGNLDLYEWIINWMALGVQKPGMVIGTAIVLRGIPGTGKGFFAYAYGSLWGAHFMPVTHESHVKGRFNAHLVGRRLVFIDEGIFGGNRQDAGVIKTRVTDSMIVMEAKGVDAIRMDNHMILIVSSNEDSVVPADIHDRRWQVLDVGERNRDDHPYFAAIEEQLNGGGRQAMLHELLERDVTTGPDPRLTIKTTGLFDQIIQGQGAELPYIFQLLDEGILPQPVAPGNSPGVTTIGAMYEELVESHPRAKYVQKQRFGRRLNKIFPTIKTVQCGTYLKGYGMYAEHKRSTRYSFPPLSVCRREFGSYVGQDVPWSNDLADWQSDDDIRQQEEEKPF